MNVISFQVDTRLAKLLAENYRSSEKALKELIDNAWDADATEVSISLPEPLSSEPIIIKDNGTGMTEHGIQKEYLVIASNRRQRRGEYTKVKKRKVKGRKGIGKFAGLLFANEMFIETFTRGKKCSFKISKANLEENQDIEDLPIELVTKKFDSKKSGTVIKLSSLNQQLKFPQPDKLRELLIQEYGREENFSILVNEKALGIDDLKGLYSEHSESIKDIGIVNLKFTISDQKKSLRQPGISLRVDGKIIGKPIFLGLDKSDDFPQNLLNKLYGEIEADGLVEHVTADWGALIENSQLFETLEQRMKPIVRDKFNERYSKELNLAQARLKKKINQRLESLPEYKRVYAEKAIRGVLSKYFGEPEEKIEPLVNVLLDAIEHSDYHTILDYINSASRSDIAKLAEVLTEFGLIEIAKIGEQALGRLEFLNEFEAICESEQSSEKTIHQILENNLWVFGLNYSFFSSNSTLKNQIEKYFNKKFTGKREKKRPDLLLVSNYSENFLLIEFKKPQHNLNFDDYQQATAYRNDFVPFTNSKIEILIIGGKKSKTLPVNYNIEPNTKILMYTEIVASARNQLNWLLKELGGGFHA